MLFNSYEFLFAFLPVTFFIYFYLLNKRMVYGAKSFMVFASLFFYSWWNILYLPIILASMLFNFIIGNSLNNNLTQIRVPKRVLLSVGILGNISLLAYFKYADFLIENTNYIFNLDILTLNLALPLAISFFTFQQIAYLVDSYRQETSEYDFLNYALFVTFFPQLIAGPIVHHKEMMPQFASKWNLIKNYKNISAALFIASMGLFKKVVIADTFASWATAGFDVAPTLNLLEAWATSLSYTFQLYFDFSGYADMAIGFALLFNIKLPINFNSPYKATNIQDFWRRWHITLSRFLKDYIYIPLGGNRKKEFRTYTNLMATFILGGIWHGAGWTFIFWGFLHGFSLVLYRIWNSSGFKLWRWLAWFITFNFVNIAWVFFRAKDWSDALKVLSAMAGLDSIVLGEKYAKYISYLGDSSWLEVGRVTQHIGDGSLVLKWVAIGFVLLMFKNSFEQLVKFKLSIRTLLVTSVTFVISFLHLTDVSEFLYFNF